MFRFNMTTLFWTLEARHIGKTVAVSCKNTRAVLVHGPWDVGLAGLFRRCAWLWVLVVRGYFRSPHDHLLASSAANRVCVTKPCGRLEMLTKWTVRTCW